MSASINVQILRMLRIVIMLFPSLVDKLTTVTPLCYEYLPVNGKFHP
jgi:hypothetical protein